MIEPSDEVFFIEASYPIASIGQTLHQKNKATRKMMIAGSRNIGSRLARQLQSCYRVKLIERKRTVAKRLASELPQTMVLAGDVTDDLSQQKLTASTSPSLYAARIPDSQ